MNSVLWKVPDQRCPVETALTSPGRMATLRVPCRRARGHRRDPPATLARFYAALDQGQKVRLAGMR